MHDTERWQDVADAINDRMLHLALTQRALSERSGVSLSTCASCNTTAADPQERWPPSPTHWAGSETTSNGSLRARRVSLPTRLTARCATTRP
jgi:hypothetical protein